jgi:hypothetical protein
MSRLVILAVAPAQASPAVTGRLPASTQFYVNPDSKVEQ